MGETGPLANRSLPCTLQCRRLLPNSRARGSIRFQVGSFKALSLPLNIGNLMHRSVLPCNFTSSFSQKIHSGENSCIADKDDALQGEHVVEALSLGVALHFNRSWFLVNF